MTRISFNGAMRLVKAHVPLFRFGVRLSGAQVIEHRELAFSALEVLPISAEPGSWVG